jgi:hypothetical protein
MIAGSLQVHRTPAHPTLEITSSEQNSFIDSRIAPAASAGTPCVYMRFQFKLGYRFVLLNSIRFCQKTRNNHPVDTATGRLVLDSLPGNRAWGELRTFGGATRDRTADLLRAKQALSQLSYSPVSDWRTQMVGLGRLELPTSPLSGVRSNHLSYRPRTHRPGLPAL